MEMHRMSDGKSFWEVSVQAMAQALSGTEKSEMKSQSSSPLPPKQIRWISTILVSLAFCEAKCPSFVDSLAFLQADQASKCLISRPWHHPG